mmetsp:Transcript_117095/g.233361  ORF Transcript_117095/g.233361 Transcript_117095/m.233361 type:complete len:84 (+) Transcript_117095:73-324(+)
MASVGGNANVAKAARVAAWALGGTTLLGFHTLIIGERQRHEGELRQRIQALQEELNEVRGELREAQRAHFLGQPLPRQVGPAK